jgi:hypothetical protein
MSKEHVFSRSIFEPGRGDIAVQGMVNMPDGSIGGDWPKARILCAHHNSALSPLDSEAKKLADGLRKGLAGSGQTVVHLSGVLLERWVLKTVINQMVSGLGSQEKWKPAPQWVQIAFGRALMPPGLGLYSLRVENYLPHSNEQAMVTPAWSRQLEPPGPAQLMGATVYFHGAAFFLLLNAMFLDALKLGRVPPGNSALPITFDRLKYHPIGTHTQDGQGRTTTARLDWGSPVGSPS